ncbi:hypothetical protein KUTeg_024475 [Tegillarca granosa]|uniref:G-protein coupled receptors family 1 profile domain-containing protein n=1 Tax=Tegillarca granosa TaxID=220873 RepID=A0ABQ9E1G8_TEGGR|nr:hypothetical protein KUTeg_024475 [Tegillarca granosa]
MSQGGFYTSTVPVTSNDYELNTTCLYNVTNTTASDEEENTNILDEVSSYLWKTISLPLFLVGMIGNLLNLVVLKRMKFWQKSTLFFLAVLAFADITVLCVGLSRYWIKNVFDFDLRTISDAGCKINFFVIYISMQYSSWILVCVTLERFIKTNFPFRINGHLFFTNGLINNRTDCDAITSKFHDFEEFAYTYMDFAFLSAIPFVSMAIMNIAIYRKLRSSDLWRRRSGFNQRGVESMHKFSMKLTRMLFFTTSTVPVSIYFIVDSYYKPPEGSQSAAKMDIAWTSTYLFQFTNYTVNFYLYTAVNMRYRHQLKLLFGCKPLGRQQKESTTNSNAVQRGIENSVFVTEESVEV